MTPIKYRTTTPVRPRLVLAPDFREQAAKVGKPKVDPFAKREDRELPVARRQIAYNMGLGREIESRNPWPSRILLLALALVLAAMWAKPAWDRLTEVHLIEIH